MNRAFVVAGANVAPRRHLAAGLDRLARVCPVRAVSAVFETSPAGDPTRPDYWNLAVEIDLDRPIAALVDVLHAVEREEGRVRPDSGGLVPLDLDLVLVEGFAGVEAGRELPAPAVLRDLHVAVPLADLAPDVPHPRTGERLAAVAARLAATVADPPLRLPVQIAAGTAGRRVALVTGGAVRLGRAIVEELAGRGWAVAFTYHTSVAAADELVASLGARGGQVAAIRANLDQAAARAAVVDAVLGRWARLDALVNSAAVFPRTPLATLTEATFAATLTTNLEAPVFLARACGDALRARGGSIVNVVDIYAFAALHDHLAYTVSKTALLGATRALAIDLAPEVRVNAVAPGAALFPTDYDPGKRARILDRTLVKREGGAAEIARAVAYLLEDTHTMTGQVLSFDGGRLIAV